MGDDKGELMVIVAFVLLVVLSLMLRNDRRADHEGPKIVQEQMAGNAARGWALSPKEARQ